MPKDYISHYKSPNIQIQPTVIIPTPPSKRAKIDGSPIKQSPKYVDISFLDDFNIDEIVSCLPKSDGMHNDSENHNKVKGTSITKRDVKLDNISNINMFEQKCTRINHTANNHTKTEGNELGFSKLMKENDNLKKDKNKVSTPVEKLMNNIETKVLTLNEDVNSTLSFKFTEYPAANIKNSNYDLNNDLENCIRIKVNVTLVPNNKLKTTCVKAKINNNLTNVEAENKEMYSSQKKKISALNNKLCELHTGDNFKTELKSIDESKKLSAKIIIRNRDDILLATLEKYILKTLHMKCSVLSIIHYGQYSKIFKCKNLAGEEYAIKMLNLTTHKNYKRGIEKKMMLKQIQSDIPKENLSCVFLHGFFTMEKHDCLVMEFYPNNLKKVIYESSKPLNLNIVQDLARQLISALMLLRNNNIVHSDIKPSHILLNCSNDKLKLCGFDQAYYNGQACITQNIGTLDYRAPEVILGYSADFSIDVWSTGLVLHEMVTGRTLFSGYNNAHILYQQMSTLGNMPPDMITLSRFGAQYFIGDRITQTFGFRKKGAQGMIRNFNKTDKLYRTVSDSYFEHWAPLKTKNQRKYDTQKIDSFVNLLQKIIVLHPKRRLTIEFIFANPFIYNIYD